MRPLLYLHIGPHKTGTTAFQHFLSHNRSLLAHAGWLYPRSGCPDTNYGHHILARSFLGRSTFDMAVLRDEIFNSGIGNIIVSSEEFSLCQNLDPIARAFEDFDARIVICCRRQDDLLLSMYNQRVKVGTFGDSLVAYAAVLEKQDRLNLFSLCARWADTFGKDRVLAAPYSASIVQDLFGRLGISCDQCEDPPSIHANKSVDARLIGALRMVSQLRGEGMDEQSCAKLLASIRSFGSKLDREKKYSLMGVRQRQEFLARYGESNAKLSDIFLQGNSFDDSAQSNKSEMEVSDDFIHPLLFKQLVSDFLCHVSASLPTTGSARKGRNITAKNLRPPT